MAQLASDNEGEAVGATILSALLVASATVVAFFAAALADEWKFASRASTVSGTLQIAPGEWANSGEREAAWGAQREAMVVYRLDGQEYSGVIETGRLGWTFYGKRGDGVELLVSPENTGAVYTPPEPHMIGSPPFSILITPNNAFAVLPDHADYQSVRLKSTWLRFARYCIPLAIGVLVMAPASIELWRSRIGLRALYMDPDISFPVRRAGCVSLVCFIPLLPVFVGLMALFGVVALIRAIVTRGSIVARGNAALSAFRQLGAWSLVTLGILFLASAIAGLFSIILVIVRTPERTT